MMPGAVLAHPEEREVFPLAPAPIVKAARGSRPPGRSMPSPRMGVIGC